MNRQLTIVIAGALMIAAVDLLMKYYLVLGAINPNLALGLNLGSEAAPLVVHALILLMALVAAARSVQLQRCLLIFLVIVSLSNLYDRVFFGHVRDYLNLLGVWFNLADLAIVTAFMTYLTYLIYCEYQTYHQRNRS